jgi:hypothetical protein
MDSVDFRDKWILRRTQRAGLCYLQCKYSSNRIVFIVSDPDFPNKFNVEVRYTAHGRKNHKRGNANYRVLDSCTKTYQFETIEEAFRDANRLMDSWNSLKGKNMPDVDTINIPFMRFATENSIDSKVQE